MKNSKDDFFPDINELKEEEPRYTGSYDKKLKTADMPEQLYKLGEVMLIKPEDPWLMLNDSIVRLPSPPEGEGILTRVSAAFVVKLLGGKIFIDNTDSKVEILSGDTPAGKKQPLTDNTVILPLHRILPPLGKGAVIFNDGRIYITDKRVLRKIQPPPLDAPYRILVNIFSDIELFEKNIISDTFGKKRQAYSKMLAVKSLALSKYSYNMRIRQLLMDGWLDYTLVYEGKIKSTEKDWVTEPSKGLSFISTIKQLISSQSTKAVVMAKPLSGEKGVINITFTGTKHITDWVNNIKVKVENELHLGFYELALSFDNNIQNIKLPKLGKILNIENLTLQKALEEGKKKDSAIKFWITGHSQGGCLTQIYIAEFMLKRGVLAENIFGYTFASPTVATNNYTKDPSDFPVYNILNMDDLPVRVGSCVRLGCDMAYLPDEKFRSENYRDYSKGKEGMYKDILPLCYWLTDSFRFGEFMAALATFATEYDSTKSALEWIDGYPALKSMYDNLKNKKNIPEAICERMIKLLEDPYSGAGGPPPSRERIEMIRNYIDFLFRKWGSGCIREYMVSTHQIPYSYAAIAGMDQKYFRPAIWKPGMPPSLITGDGENLLAERSFPEINDQ